MKDIAMLLVLGIIAFQQVGLTRAVKELAEIVRVLIYGAEAT